MEIQKIASSFACAALLAGLSGCAGDSTLSTNPLSAYVPGGGSASSAYESELANHSQRSIVSPVFGESSYAAPTKTQRLVSAVTDNRVTNSITGAVKQTTGYLTPSFNKKTEVDPISLARHAKAPDAELYLRMAERHKSIGKVNLAETMYKKALEEEPGSLEALLGYARLQDSQDRLAEATQLYSQATTQNPKHAGAFNDLGLCFARRGMMTESRVALERAVSLQPDRVLYRNNLATVLVEVEQFDQAIESLAHVHGAAVANHNLGVLLKQSDRPEQARVYFAQALRLNPQLAAAQIQLASLPRQAANLGYQAPQQTQYPQQNSTYPKKNSALPVSQASSQQQAIPPTQVPIQQQQATPTPTATPEYLQPYGTGSTAQARDQPVYYGQGSSTQARIPPVPSVAYPPLPGQFGAYQPQTPTRPLPTTPNPVLNNRLPPL